MRQGFFYPSKTGKEKKMENKKHELTQKDSTTLVKVSLLPAVIVTERSLVQMSMSEQLFRSAQTQMSRFRRQVAGHKNEVNGSCRDKGKTDALCLQHWRHDPAEKSGLSQ